jgi:hypothetical protein
MRSLLVTPVVLMALVAVPGQTYPITGLEASAAMKAQIHRQVRHRLSAGFSGTTFCTGVDVGQQEITATTQLAQWRCELTLRGVHFRRPCKALADVFGTDQPNHPRIQWLHESEYCHERE